MDTPIVSAPPRWKPERRSGVALVDQLMAYILQEIETHGYRAGMRLPSIRQLAEQCGVSRFTVVEAYERLVATGHVHARKGAGFYVTPRHMPASDVSTDTVRAPSPSQTFDTPFLLRSMFNQGATSDLPGGAGLLPASWLDQDMVASAVRHVARTAGEGLLSYGVPQGYRPLRQQIASALQAQDVPAHPDRHLMTTAGVTHALDLIVRTFVKPGDTVLVEDPGWFLVFGRLAERGVHVVGVPRLVDGPDTTALARLAQAHRPKLFILNTVVHNPTGYSLSAGIAYEVLQIAERHDVLLVEDDTYSDFHPGRPLRLAALDRLDRVILVGGYAKTLAAGMRVGYVAAAPATIDLLVDTKLLAGLTTSGLGEQVIHRILVEGQYRRHIERLRARVDQARGRCLRALSRIGHKVPQEPVAGMFVWLDCGQDSEALARRAAAHGLLLAPGVLFSPEQAFSTKMRISVPLIEARKGWQILEQLLTGPL